MRSFLSIVAAPTLCLSLLGAVALEARRHVTPADTNPFHAKVSTAIAAWPTVAGDWQAVKQPELPEAAIKLLKPIAHFYRIYARRGPSPAPVGLLVVQCRRPDDMSGHYPPNCYPSSGKPMVQD